MRRLHDKKVKLALRIYLFIRSIRARSPNIMRVVHPLWRHNRNFILQGALKLKSATGLDVIWQRIHMIFLRRGRYSHKMGGARRQIIASFCTQRTTESIDLKASIVNKRHMDEF